MASNMHYGLFPICILCANYTHNSKTKDRIRTFYFSNNCSTIEDIYFLVRPVCEIRSASYGSKHASQPLFDTAFCVCTYARHSKLQVVCRHSTYQTTSSPSDTSIFCVRAGCKIRLASYDSKHASSS